mgnify:CR=1 FL=1
MDTQQLQTLKNRYDIIGNDQALNRALEIAVAVAPTDLTVLITGESGVGKENIPKIIHVSCFEDKSKNITGLLHSLKALKDNGINYQASLIGDGMDFVEMCKCSEQLKLNDRVRFTGVLEGQELFDEIASGDFFVLSSNYETASIVVIEALMCGLPVVSTKVGCVPDIINENNGIVVPVHDENALTEAMAQMCEKYKNYDAQSLRDAVIDNYSKRPKRNLWNSDCDWNKSSNCIRFSKW